MACPGNENRNGPIFIAGCGRSGTTYLQTIISAHPDVFIPTECLFLADYIRRGHLLPRGLRRWLFFHEPQLRAWYRGPSFPLADIPSAIGDIHRQAAAGEGRRLWGQKTPRFVRHMEDFDRAFPNGRWVLIYRDPRAVVASMLKSPRHTYRLAHACRRWVRDNGPVVRHLASPACHVKVVRYEDLVRRFDELLPEIFGFLSLSPLTRQEVVRRAVVREREYAGRGFGVRVNTVREGVEPRPQILDNWKKFLTRAQVREIERRCAPVLEKLGYQPLTEEEAAALPSVRWEGARRALSPLKDLLVVWQYARYWPYYPIHHMFRRAAMFAFSGRGLRLPGRRKPAGGSV